MIIPDANILLYAYIPSFKEHNEAKSWFETTLSAGSEIIGLSWQVITAFIRIGTNPRIFRVPFKIEDVESRLSNLLAHPLVQTAVPTDKHWGIFSKILREEQIAADLVMDAHLAALAVEHKAKIATTDRDFLRFSQIVKVFNPLKP
jgi:toxin-antitoxin system PIN domain toxin